MAVALTINIILAAAIFVAVVGPLVWAIQTQSRDVPACPSIAGLELTGPNRPTAAGPRRRAASRVASRPREVARS
jgi:hypothetical protein